MIMFKNVNRRFRLIVATLIAVILFCLPAASGFAAVALFTKSTNGQPTSAVISQMQVILDNYLAQDTALRNWKLLDQKITQVSANQFGYDVSIIFDIDRQHLLNFARAEDSPALKGRLAYVEKHGKQLPANALDKANKEIAMWKHDLHEYITTPQNCFDRIKVTATLDTGGTVKPDTVKYYREDAIGNFVPASLQEIPSNAKVEQDAFDTIKANAKEAAKANTVQPAALVNYDRYAARDYVLQYSSNTSLTCSNGSTKQNPAYYNSNYAYYDCNDCANFVSQGLYAGGIVTDGTWYPGSSAWISVSSLTNYMVSRQYWIESANINDCVAGMPFKQSGVSHVMMMNYNDGSTRKYCGHTNDRRDVSWTGSGVYYRINY